MKNKKLKGVNIVATVIFAVAFFLNIQSGFHEGHGLLGIAAIGQGTGSGGSGSGSGSGGCPINTVCGDIASTAQCTITKHINCSVTGPLFIDGYFLGMCTVGFDFTYDVTGSKTICSPRNPSDRCQPIECHEI